MMKIDSTDAWHWKVMKVKTLRALTRRALIFWSGVKCIHYDFGNMFIWSTEVCVCVCVSVCKIVILNAQFYYFSTVYFTKNRANLN